MVRRQLLSLCAAFGFGRSAIAASEPGTTAKIEPLRLSDAEWKKRLAPFQYRVLRQESKIANIAKHFVKR